MIGKPYISRSELDTKPYIFFVRYFLSMSASVGMDMEYLFFVLLNKCVH
ncbi:MAG: hypothetical protein J6Y71_05695 [Ruminococcus sp.]|nr:hypothetical protein [Ruminococcus sp.]